MRSPLLTAVICLTALLGSLAARAQDTAFEAKVQVMDLLDAESTADRIGACTEGAELAPKHVDVEIGIDDQGKLTDLAVAPELGTEAEECVRAALSGLSFPVVEGGLSVSHRIKLKAPAAAEDEDEEPAAPPAPGEFTDPDASRIVYAQTGIPREEGVFDATAHNLGFWVAEYGVHENVAIGLKFLLPIGFIALNPNIRTGFQAAEKVWLGAAVNFLYFSPYIDVGDGNDFDVLTYGGTLSLSAGDDTFLFNFAFTGQGATVIPEGDPNNTEGFFLPQLGVSIRLHEMVKLNVELSTPLVTDEDFMSELAGRFWLVMYGLRIHGSWIYGDISFIWPAQEGVWDDFMKYMPMGIPMLSFGFQLGGGDDSNDDSEDEPDEDDPS
jgi:hypothetical protein